MGFDQRGIAAFQITFPAAVDRWAALSVNAPQQHRFCWSGGALIGRNPLAMPWSGAGGGKSRKNNFLLSEGGLLRAEGVRLHNTHDAFLASSNQSGFDIEHVWLSWNRDDFFEGYLHDLSVRHTLVDGTFTFLSDPDGDCNAAKDASAKRVVIENSLIRIQRMPGPYGKHSDKWHWKIEGGHHQLWKRDSCSWSTWPDFELRNNVFLIEGPGTTYDSMNKIRCNLALPGDCDRPTLNKLVACENNLFLYQGYHHWVDADATPGPTPQPGDAFHNPDNPNYLPNGRDCYQRVTDDPRDVGHGQVVQLWRALRDAWIERHTGHENPLHAVMQIAGIDYPGVAAGRRIRLINRKGEKCLQSSAAKGVSLQPCSDAPSQVLSVVAFDDGKLMGALLLRDSDGAYLRSQDPSILETDNDDGRFDPRVFRQPTQSATPDFAERWYLLPRDGEPGAAPGTFIIESDALRRSFLHSGDAGVAFQPYFVRGEQTPLPQAIYPFGDDWTMQWRVEHVN